jgi:hypothetical protein
MVELTRASIDEGHYVARYAQGRLEGAELEAFEEYCLLHPDVAEQVRTDRALLVGLRALEPRRRVNRRPVYALAAGIALVVAAAAVWTTFSLPADTALYALGDAMPATARQRITNPLRVVRVRDEAAQILPVPADATAAALDIEPAATRGEPLVNVVLDEEIDGQWRQRGERTAVAADADDGTIRVVIDLTKLESVHLRVKLRSRGEKSDDFNLRIERQTSAH